MSIDVVVVTEESVEHLTACLSSPDGTTIVVDNASSDGAADLADASVRRRPQR